MKEHGFTSIIRSILKRHFGALADEIFDKSELIQYLNIKTVSASRGSKARGSFGNLYAIYVLVEDYVSEGFAESEVYENYEGARFSDLLKRQRELPFGGKLQNHAFNHRLNQEFKKYFPNSDFQPILRDVKSNRYWFNENLLVVPTSNGEINLATSVIEIIDAYITAKQEAFDAFLRDCERMKSVQDEDHEEVIRFIVRLLRPNVDARIFEIVSYAILKAYYSDVSFFWGWSLDDITEEKLTLYKTGRTNANDGGIDFVMRPVGRFYQVTETLDVKKYFLDIDKVQKYPITFVIKTDANEDEILSRLREQAKRQYGIQAIVDRYMASIEEVINIPKLIAYLRQVEGKGDLGMVIDEIVQYSRLEFDIFD